MSFKVGGQEVPLRTVLLFASEGLLILLVLLATLLVFPFLLRPPNHQLSWRDFLQVSVIALVCEVCLYYRDAYTSRVSREFSFAFVSLLEAFGISCLLTAGLYCMFPRLVANNWLAAMAVPLTVVLICSWRLLLDRAGVNKRRSERAVVLGTGPVGIAAVREVCSRPELNLEVVGFLDSDPKNVGKPLVNPGIVATIDDLEAIVDRHKVQRVIIAPTEQQAVPVSRLLRLKFAGIVLEDAGALLERITGRIAVHSEPEPRWLMLSEGFRQTRLSLAIKRCADVLGASVLLVLSLPLMVLIAVAIGCETGFPILFWQKRAGLNGKPFNMAKFRSMVRDAERKGPSWTTNHDLRITRVGRFIRKYRLDELPQFWNVIRGEMSLVGPRPEQPYFCELLERQIPFFEERHKVRPGITGWAQIKYQYAGSVDDAKRKLEFDMFYIKHPSLLLDVVILLETVKVILLARGSK